EDVAHDPWVQVHAVTDEFNDDLPTAGRSERRRYRPGQAVVDGTHSVEEVGDGGAPAGSRECGDAGGDRLTHRRLVSVSVTEGGDGAALDQSVEHAGQVRSFRGDRHRAYVPATQFDEFAGERGVPGNDVRGVLRPAAGVGDERPFEVDPGDDPLV